MTESESDAWVDFDDAFLRVVPHVHVGEFEVVELLDRALD